MLNRYPLLLIGVLYLVSSVGCALNSRSKPNGTDALDSQLSLARLSERHGKLDFARQIYENALRNEPESKLAHHRMGVIEARRGRLDEAKRHFSIAMKDGKAGNDLLSDYGYTLYLMDDLESAEEVLRRVTDDDPQHKAARNNLALVLGEQGRFDESLDEFRMVVDEAEALANLAYIKSQMGEFEEAEHTYHRALAMKQDMRPAAEALLQLAGIEDAIASVPPAADPLAAPNPPALERVARDPPHRPSRQAIEDGPMKPSDRDGYRVANPSLQRSESEVQPASYLAENDFEQTPRRTAARPPRRVPRTSPQNVESGDRPTPNRLPATRRPRSESGSPPPFFPSAANAKQISPHASETPRASKIESAAYDPPGARFESSFVDDAHEGFPGSMISEAQWFDQ